MTGARPNQAERWRISTEQDRRNGAGRGRPRTQRRAAARALATRRLGNARRAATGDGAGSYPCFLSCWFWRHNGRRPDAKTERHCAATGTSDTDAPFPSATASDIVSYADHVALVTAISEGEAPRETTPPGEFPPGETAVYRQVTVRLHPSVSPLHGGAGSSRATCGGHSSCTEHRPCSSARSTYVDRPRRDTRTQRSSPSPCSGSTEAPSLRKIRRRRSHKFSPARPATRCSRLRERCTRPAGSAVPESAPTRSARRRHPRTSIVIGVRTRRSRTSESRRMRVPRDASHVRWATHGQRDTAQRRETYEIRYPRKTPTRGVGVAVSHRP